MDGTAKQDQGAAAGTADETSAKGYAVDTMGIMRALPHRYPFLMIDRVEQIIPGQSAIGIKNVSINEFYFQGHFPHVPLMPGVLVVEAMAQTAAMLVMETIGGPEIAGTKGVYFMAIEGAKFRRPVSPGDQLRIHVAVDRHRGTVWKFTGVAKVDGAVVAEATYTAMVNDRANQV
jgi:3-hydroxyacyl-[acyl-carrier-protein] dehydratase